MDLLKNCKKKISKDFFKKVSSTGNQFDFTKKYLLVVNHPLSTESKKYNNERIKSLIKSLAKINMHKIIFWPNADTNSNVIAQQMRIFREGGKDKDFTYIINTTPEQYALLMYNASCLVGNSSSFIREGSHLGIPAVILGDRQRKREVGRNVVFTNYQDQNILSKINYQIKKENTNLKTFTEMAIQANILLRF